MKMYRSIPGGAGSSTWPRPRVIVQSVLTTLFGLLATVALFSAEWDPADRAMRPLISTEARISRSAMRAFSFRLPRQENLAVTISNDSGSAFTVVIAKVDPNRAPVRRPEVPLVEAFTAERTLRYERRGRVDAGEYHLMVMTALDAPTEATYRIDVRPASVHRPQESIHLGEPATPAPCDKGQANGNRGKRDNRT